MKIKALAASGIAIVAVLAVAASGESTTADEATSGATSAAQPGETSQQGDADPGATAGIGTPVRDGKFEFVVTNVEPGVPSVGDDFIGETAQGAFTLVNMTVTNIGNEPQFFSDTNVAGIDSQGREVAADGTASLYANEDASTTFTEINPGNSVTVNVVFDLPVGETLTAVEVKDSAFSGGATVTLN